MSFQMTSPMWGELYWEDGVFSGDEFLVELVERTFRSGKHVPTIVSGPSIAAADSPWFAAHAALRDIVDDGEWLGHGDIDPGLLSVPDDAVA